MKQRKTVIDYYGMPKEVNVLFTFRFKRSTYALIDFGKDNLRIINLKWLPITGIYVWNKTESETAVIAEKIY